MLILRGQLGSAPRLEYDLIAPESWTGRSALRTAEQRKWGSQELDDLHFLAPKASLPVSSQGAPQLLETARRIHPHPWLLAVRREYLNSNCTSLCQTRKPVMQRNSSMQSAL